MKRLVSLLLCVAMVMTVLSFAAAEDRPTVTMMNRLPSSYVVEDNPAIEALEDLLGVNLESKLPRSHPTVIAATLFLHPAIFLTLFMYGIPAPAIPSGAVTVCSST